MPPLTFLQHFGEQWTCCVCTTDYRLTDPKPWATEDGDTVCPSCIIKMFRDAMNAPIYRPPKWGRDTMLIGHFAHANQLSRRFIARVRDAELLYEQRQASNRPRAAQVPPGQILGVDCQLCPTEHCRIPITLEDGCNHVQCKECDIEFCYICGQPALNNSGHWAPSGCPRYGNIMTANRIYDPAGEPEEFAFSFEYTAWNIAMQTGSNTLRRRMRRLLAASLSGFQYVHLGQVSSDLAQSYHPDLAVTQQSWQERAIQEHDYLSIFLAELLLEQGIRNGQQPWPLSMGYLYRPVAGYFNVVNLQGRERAIQWATERIDNYSEDDPETPDNYAVIDLGPGGTDDARRDAFDLMCFLIESGETVTQGRIRFHNMTGNAFLLQVLSSPNPATRVLSSRPTGRFNSLDRLERLFVGYRHSLGLGRRVTDLEQELGQAKYVPYEDRDDLNDGDMEWQP
ncbi:hypothetical protein Q7P37_002350 [Cladosporium fusiforme]